MNVLVITQYFWPENFRVNDLVRSLKKNGTNIEVLTGKPNYPDGKIFPGYRAWSYQRENWNNIPVHRVPLAPRGSSSGLRLIINYLSFVIAGTLFAPFVLRRKKVDVLFVYAVSPILQAIPAIVLKWVKRAKLVIWVQDLWPESLEATGFVRNRWLLAIVRGVVRWIYRQSDLILVQSEAFIEPVAALADREKICYYPNAADDVFSTSSASADSAIGGLDEGFSIVFAGNLGSAQSLETIVEAAELLRHLPGIRIFLVGDGSRAEWMRDQIRTRNLDNIVMAGRHRLESMPAILCRAGALLVTLKNEPIFFHTVPSKVQAYLAVGRPIIACMNGEGARIILEANAGVSCAAEDAASLAAAITKLSNMNHGERERLGQNGRAYFQEHYDSSTLTQTLILRFRNLVMVRAR